ncbi:hypothetical protein G5I_04852 [Acromyrmex echinatior]|uniref:Uncharacterized protein n=1 Tax=Acromyrmex echinatior TaxID=103372 RepID=F4WGQ7_ACREC|nr:hypothetical protein G5I_04852 [Acromyrmex echinatior]
MNNTDIIERTRRVYYEMNTGHTHTRKAQNRSMRSGSRGTSECSDGSRLNLPILLNNRATYHLATRLSELHEWRSMTYVAGKCEMSKFATTLTSVAQLRRAFTAKIFLGDQMTGGVKRNATEMHLHAAALKGDTQSQNNSWAPGTSKRATLSRNCANFSLRNILAGYECRQALNRLRLAFTSVDNIVSISSDQARQRFRTSPSFTPARADALMDMQILHRLPKQDTRQYYSTESRHITIQKSPRQKLTTNDEAVALADAVGLSRR